MMNNGYTYLDRISRAQHGCSALEYYVARHPHFTSAEWRERFRDGRITCAGIVLKEGDPLRAGQLLEYFRSPWAEPAVPGELPILFQSERVMVFDKPDSMPVIPGGEYLENSMVMAVRRRHGAALSPLHRLGRGTTGVILFTRTAEAAAAFSGMMRERRLQKTYLALVHGSEMPESFTVDTPIGRVPHARLGEIHDVAPQGKASISHCMVLARRAADDTALVQVIIPTGRTHQIRIHLASIGHPLLDDAFYLGPDAGGVLQSGAADTVLPGDAGYILHSWKLSYRDPFTDTETEIVAPVRKEIVKWKLESEGRGEV